MRACLGRRRRVSGWRAGLLIGGMLSIGLIPSAVFASPLRIAFGRGPGARMPSSVGSVWIADADGHHQRLLGHDSKEPLSAPDGTAVAAVANMPARGINEWLAIFSANGQRTQHYLSDAFASPLAWSPDSRYLAAARLASGGGLGVIDTSDHTERIVAGSIGEASFAPRGPDRLVYNVYSRRGGYSFLLTSAPDGSHRRQLTHSGQALMPAWGPHQIAFIRRGQIWLVTPNGSRTRQLTHIHNGFTPEDPIYWAPNGRVLIATATGKVGPTQDDPAVVSIATGHTTILNIAGFNSAYVGVNGISANSKRVLLGRPYPGTAPITGGPIDPFLADTEDPSWNAWP